VEEAFFALCVQKGKEVLPTLMEQERTSLCGAKGVPNPERRAVRGGYARSRVALRRQRLGGILN
jgi:putative transposase